MALPAARTGADVTASDLTPELLAKGRADAEAAGLTINWQVADAEAQPFADGEFDTVVSCVGAMFAPHHQVAADELARTCRPGGTIGLVSWTPEGFIGQMFATMKPYAPPPPPGAQPPPLWGNVDHVRELFGDRVQDLQRAAAGARRGTGSRRRRSSVDVLQEHYGPTIAAYGFNKSDPEKVAALDEALADLGRRFGIGEGAYGVGVSGAHWPPGLIGSLGGDPTWARRHRPDPQLGQAPGDQGPDGEGEQRRSDPDLTAQQATGDEHRDLDDGAGDHQRQALGGEPGHQAVAGTWPPAGADVQAGGDSDGRDGQD